MNEKISIKNKTYGRRNFTGLTENRNSWKKKTKTGVCIIKVNFKSGLVNMHTTDNNMEITSSKYYLLFPYFLPV